MAEWSDVKQNGQAITMRIKKSFYGNRCFYIAGFATFILIFLFRTVLFSTPESGTDSASYNTETFSKILYAPTACEDIQSKVKNTNVYSMDSAKISKMALKTSDGKCTCQDTESHKSKNFESAIDSEDLKETRKKLLENYKKQNWDKYASEPSRTCNPKSPIHYPIQPITVEPRSETTIPGISLVPNLSAMVQISLSATHGLVTAVAGGKVQTIENHLVSVSEANGILGTLRYNAIFYDARPYRDFITIDVVINQDHDGKSDFFSNFEKRSKAQIPVQIEKKDIPNLPVYHGDTVEEKVTIVIKTYMRYTCVRHLIYSIQKFYPKIAILVADDSEINHREQLSEFKNVFHFYMPPNYGWFAGRNLLVSQVKTEYYIWCDDDFVFHDKTNLTYLLDKIERSGYDIVGGGVNTDQLCAWAEYMKIDTKFDTDKGFCIKREMGFYGNWEDCHVGDNILNFYIARTESSSTVRFNPNYDTFAHLEFFTDATNKLRIMVCPAAWVGHRKDLCVDGNILTYQIERSSTREKFKQNYFRTYFSQFAQCRLDPK